MAIFTLEDAARFSGRSPRELRLLIEKGQIPGRRRGGRWTVTSHDLERALPQRGFADPDAHAHPPVGADPDDPFAPARPAEPDPSGDRDARLVERIRRLEHELAEVRGELAQADARVIDLERAALDTTRPSEPVSTETERKPARARRSSASRGPAKSKRSASAASDEEDSGSEPDGMRQALTPLFRPEGRRPRNGGSRSRRSGAED